MQGGKDLPMDVRDTINSHFVVKYYLSLNIHKKQEDCAMTTDALPKLRPLGMGQLLDQAIRLYRRNFLKFIGIIAVVQIPLTLFNLLASLLTFGDMFAQTSPGRPPPTTPSEMFTPRYFAGMGSTCILGIVGFVLIQGIATAALTWAVADHYLGKSTSFLGAYRKVGRSWLGLIGAMLLAFIISIGLFVWLLVPCIGWLTGAGILAFFWLAIVPLLAPIVVLEKQQALQAIRRAWDLVRRRFWWVMGFITILAVFNQLIVSGPTLLITLLFQFLAQSFQQLENLFTAYVLQTAIQSLLALIASLVYLPLQQTSITLMYFDLRVRTEGFDLALQAEGTSGATTAIEELIAQAPPPETKGLVTWTELGYFALLSLGVIIVYVAVVMVSMIFGLALVGLSRPPGF